MENENPNKFRLIYWGVGAVVVLVLILILNPFVVISAGERGVVLNWGAVSDEVFDEGLHFRMPIKQQVQKLDIKVQKEEVDASAASRDLQIVTARIALNYHLDAVKINRLWQLVGSEYKTRIIDPAIQEALKAVTAKYTAEELITKRSQVKDDAKKLLAERLVKEYILVDEFSIVNFDFSRVFNEAIEKKVTNEQNALASKNLLEQKKYEAEQIVVTAKANAESIRIQAQAVTSQGGADYVRLQAISRWDGKLPQQFVPGSAIPFLGIDLIK